MFLAGSLYDGTLVGRRGGHISVANTRTGVWRYLTQELPVENQFALATDGDNTVWFGLGNDLMTMDPSTGDTALVVTMPGRVTNITYDDSTATLYALTNANGFLYTIDLAAGSATASVGTQFYADQIVVRGTHAFIADGTSVVRRDAVTSAYEAYTAIPSYSPMAYVTNFPIAVVGGYVYRADGTGTHFLRVPVDAQPNPMLWPWTGLDAPDYQGPFEELVSDGTALHNPVWTGEQLYASSGESGVLYRLVPSN